MLFGEDCNHAIKIMVYIYLKSRNEEWNKQLETLNIMIKLKYSIWIAT